MSTKIDLKESVDRIKLFRVIIDNDTQDLIKTEKGCSVVWPAYVATVDLMKELICSVTGFRSLNEAAEMGKDDEVHDLACDLVGRVFNWVREG